MVCLRYFNLIFSQSFFWWVVSNFINNALRNDNLFIYGDGSQTRSFCYVSDTVNGIHKLLNSDYQYPINIGNNDEYTILQLVNIMKNIVNKNIELIFSKLPENDPKKRQPNIKLAKTILDWNPKTSLKDGLIKTIDYFIKLNKFG